ncbi:MAG: hypothetical protein EBU52_18475, partial [Cytophagia bacterium]|nr:hypothetical protein [Cytophagia bacterium]
PQITSQKELYSSEVTLNWLDNSTNEAGFKIEKSTSPTFASFTTHLLSSNSTEFYFDKLDSATSYYFRVRAFTDRIESYNSPVYTVTTPGSPFQKNEIASINLTENNVHSGWIRMSDINGDKLCDYLVMIPKANDNLLRLYINKGNGSFELAIEFRDTSPPLDIQLADIDNDFDLDVVYKGGYGLVSLINKGSSFEKRIIFKDMVGFSYDCGVLRNDYDLDGDEDIFLYDKTAPSAAWFKNNRNGEFSFDSLSHLKKRFTNVNLVDIDNNGKVDLMADEAYAEKNNFYVNQGGVFQFVPYSPGSISNLLPADTDNDGDIDLVSVNSNRNTIQILINNGTTTFTVSESFSSTTGYFIDRGAPVDIDNDGDTDFVFDSQDGGTVFINKGNNKFVSITNFEFQFYGTTRLIKVLDFDGDSKLDVVMYHEYQKKLVVWKNVMPFITTRPSNPVQLTAVVGVGSATVNWANATDDKTPSASLRYNYYIGKTAVGQEVRSANMFHDNGRYFKLYPQGSNQAVITNLEKGNYYWGVQTVDAALQSSIFSTSTFQISESNYIRPPKGLTLQNYSPYQNNISWVDDSDNEEGFILIRSNTPYSGYKIIATLPANQTYFNDVGLQHFTGYFYRVVAFKGSLRSDLSPILFSQTLPLLSQTFGKFKTTPPVKIADYGNMQWVDLNGDNKRD